MSSVSTPIGSVIGAGSLQCATYGIDDIRAAQRNASKVVQLLYDKYAVRAKFMPDMEVEVVSVAAFPNGEALYEVIVLLGDYTRMHSHKWQKQLTDEAGNGTELAHTMLSFNKRTAMQIWVRAVYWKR